MKKKKPNEKKSMKKRETEKINKYTHTHTQIDTHTLCKYKC